MMSVTAIAKAPGPIVIVIPPSQEPTRTVCLHARVR
jgi:hypothetical protein